MNVHSIWEVYLPLKFTVGNEFKKTQLSQFSFEINGVNIELLRKEDSCLIDRLRIHLYEEYDEKCLPSHKHLEYLSDFIDFVTFKAGSVAQKFLDGFSRNSNDENHYIFNGEDFITQYEFCINPNILSGRGSGGDSSYYLDDEILTKSIDFVTRRKGILDNSWYLIRDAEHAMYLGKYEISLIYMAIVIEFLITSALNNFLKSNGEFKSKYVEEIRALFGEKPSFIDKYFSYGLSLLTNKKLSDEVLMSVDFIYKVRNKLAHGKQLFEIAVLTKRNINELNVRSYWHELTNDTIEVHNFFFELNKELKLWK